MTFKDHFSDRSALYATFRPDYPASLFTLLARLTPSHRVALDCGTGNGQAAIGLADHFERVVATDESTQQLAHAIPNARIEYRLAPADESGLPDASVDLVTAAQALHWFEIAAFFEEATRVLVPDGAIAIWGYGDPTLDTASLHATLHQFNRGTLEPYWLPERQLLLDGYSTVRFPFREIQQHTMLLERRWTLPELAGYLRTWSATSHYAEKHGSDPVADVEDALARDWGDPATPRIIRWPLHLRVGSLPR